MSLGHVSAQKKALDLGRDSVGKLVAKLAIPAVIAQLINLLYNLVDRMYVGAIEGIGRRWRGWAWCSPSP